MGLGWWKLDPGREGRLSWSSATYRIFGLAPAEFDGNLETFFRLVHPDDAPRVSAAVTAALESSSVPLRVEHRIVRPDGSVRWVQQSGIVEWDDQAGGPRRMLGICQDITDRRRIEDENRAAAAYNRSLFEASPDPLVTIDPKGAITDVNSATERATGYSRAELLGTEFCHYFTEPDTAHTVYEQAFRTGAAVCDNPLELRHRDGHTISVLYNASVYREPSGVLGVLAAARDITAQRAAEAEVQAINAELETRVAQRTAELSRANSTLESFSYSVAHDLRAPLRALSGYSDALLEDYGDRLEETGRGYLGRIEAASEQMASLIDDLLQLSQVSRVEMSLEPVDLSAEAAAIAAALASRDPGRRVRFAIQDGVRVTADRSLIRSVVQNLLENAWKFTARRDGAVIEFASTAAEDGGVCYYVRDNGAGFDPAYAGKLFKPFERLHAVTEFPGTGIGLASVARIVERHGGRVWAQGAVDRGATFYFTLGGAQLAVILNYVSFVSEDVAAAAGPDPAGHLESASADLGQIKKAAERAAGLPTRRPVFARRDVNRPRVLDLDTVVTEVEELLRRTIGEHVELVTSLAGDLWPVLADPGQLEQVLVDLAVNARDATPEAGR